MAEAMTKAGAGWREDFDALLGLGSNIGDKVRNIEHAIELLTGDGDIRLVRSSRIYRTEPWGELEQDWFANACIAVATKLSASSLLDRCLGVENTMKRVRTERWGPRIIDVDVLVYRDQVSRDPHLLLPHPRIFERAFVLAPLADIAPNLVIEGKTVAEGLAHLGCDGVSLLD